MTRSLVLLILLLTLSIPTSADISTVPEVDRLGVIPGPPLVIWWHQIGVYDVNDGAYLLFAATGGIICPWIGWGSCDCEYAEARTGGTDWTCRFDNSEPFRERSYPGRCYYHLFFDELGGPITVLHPEEHIYWDCPFVALLPILAANADLFNSPLEATDDSTD